jgi:hypothetical protein
VFSPSDIESGRFPNVLAGEEDTQAIQKFIVLFIFLCIISFTIAIIHKKIREIVKNRREGFKRYQITFDLYLAVPITILSSVLILYVCELIPLSVIVHSLIEPPLDATEGAAIDAIVTYKNITYKQGDLLLYAGIFWFASFVARSVMTYLIAKILIKKLYKEEQLPPEKRYPKALLASTSTFIMGEPMAIAIILFFSKSTYSISPVYLFFLFLVLDIIRMSVLVLVIPRLTMRNNNLLYHGLQGISLIGGLIQLLLFGMLLKILWITKEIQSDFLPIFTFICLIAGLVQLSQLILISGKRKTESQPIRVTIMNGGLMILWGWIIFYITTTQDPILLSGLPVILAAITIIILAAAHIGISRVINIRKINKTRLSLESFELLINGSSESFNISSRSSLPDDRTITISENLPVDQPIRIKGNLKYMDKERKAKGLKGEKVTFDNGQGRIDESNIKDNYTNAYGKFSSEGKTPSQLGSFKFHAHFKGTSIWDGKGSTKNKMKNSDQTQNIKNKNIFQEITFSIDVKQPARSHVVEYKTRLRNTSLSISSGNFKEGKFVPNDTFSPTEVVTFCVELIDMDSNIPVIGQANIELLLTDDNKLTNILPPTNNDGKTYTSIIASSVTSDAWTYQARYSGNSIYDRADSPIKTYSTSQSVVQ